MKLIYVYIPDYFALNDVNFNLGGKYRFNYDKTTKDFRFEVNEYYLENFFDVIENRDETQNYAIIKQVGAIIGENGTGKSTFLEFIKNNFIRGLNGFRQPAIVTFESYTENKSIIYIAKEIEVNEKSLNELNKNGFIVKRYGVDNKKIPPFDILEYDDLEEAKDIDYIYLSNIFDRKEEVEFDGLYNLSTNYLLKEDTRKKIENGLDINPVQLIEEHTYEEIEREINFINGFKNKYRNYLNFTLPKNIVVYIVFKSGIKSSDQVFETKVYYFLKSLDDYLKNELIQDNYQKFILILTNRIINNFFIEYYKYSPTHPFSFEINELNLEKLRGNNPDETFSNILDFLIDKTKNIFPLNKRLIAIKDLLNFIDKYFKKNSTSVNIMLNAMQFRLSNEKEQEEFLEFHNLYRETYLFDSYFNFDWGNISTGEKALLNIYARLFYLSDNEVNRRSANHLLRDDILLLIDEGELYLHPTWQKEILFQLLKILPIIFKRDKEVVGKKSRNIQIILTSNSPILITDIPSSNICFLQKIIENNSSKIVIQDSLNDHKQTFASNIHTLLSDSFFMKNGLMGDFAILRIDQIINELTLGKTLNPKKRDEIRKIIQQIGEPILKHKLMQMYNDRYNMNIHERLDKIEDRLNLNNDQN